MPTTSGLGSAQTSQSASATLTRTVPAPFDPNATATATVEGLTITLTKHLSVTGFPIAGQFDVFVSGPDADAELGTAQIPLVSYFTLQVSFGFLTREFSTGSEPISQNVGGPNSLLRYDFPTGPIGEIWIFKDVANFSDLASIDPTGRNPDVFQFTGGLFGDFPLQLDPLTSWIPDSIHDFFPVPSGPFVISEDQTQLPRGWQFSEVACETTGDATATTDQATATATINFGPRGGTADCVFFNQAVASVTLAVARRPDGPADAPPDDGLDFGMTDDPPLRVQQLPTGSHDFAFLGPDGPFQLTLNTPQTAVNTATFILPPGAHNFSQTSPAPGWAFSSPVQCTSNSGASFSFDPANITLDLAPFEEINCTFFNTFSGSGGPGGGPGGPATPPGGPGGATPPVGGPGGPVTPPGGPGGGPPPVSGPGTPPPAGLPATGSGGLVPTDVGTPGLLVLLLTLTAATLALGGVRIARRRR